VTRAVLQRPAEADLREIWTYSAEKWDANQADRYLDTIAEAIERLVHEPLRGRACDDLRPGYRRQRVGSHVIFYVVEEMGISVARSLHQHMDYEGRL